VADFGGFTAGEILFERKSSAGDSAKGEGTREEVAQNAEASISSASLCWEMNQPSNKINNYSEQATSPTLTARMGTGGNQVPIVHSIPIENHPADKVIAFEDRHDEGVRFMMGGKTNTLTAAMGTGGNNVPLIKTIAIEGNGSRPSHKGNGYKETDKMYTLNATEVHGVGVFPQQAFDEYGEGKPLSTLKAQGGSYGGGQ
jgi:DNA (cytosine-5)-methyltransferase 1